MRNTRLVAGLAVAGLASAGVLAVAATAFADTPSPSSTPSASGTATRRRQSISTRDLNCYGKRYRNCAPCNLNSAPRYSIRKVLAQRWTGWPLTRPGVLALP